MLTAVILTRDEAAHIDRAIRSVTGIADRVLVVDSGSTDATVPMAKAAGAIVHRHTWTNYAAQFNWALSVLPEGTTWVLRLDADETVAPALGAEIADRLQNLPPSVAGVSVNRRMNFLGAPVRRGGVFPVRVVRLFRAGEGRCETRWMDEHIVCSGSVVPFRGEILDDNLKSLSWWTDKHNAYASREVVDLLNLEHGFLATDPRPEGRAGAKRMLKERVYAHLPPGMRATLYFLYRFFLRGGIFDGPQGVAFHVLQGFWYRYLVDAKLREVRAHMRRERVRPEVAIEAVLGLRIST